MNDLEALDLAFLYVADALDPDEREHVELRVETGDAELRDALVEAESLHATLPLALEPQLPSPALESELMARIQPGESRDEADRGSVVVRPRRFRRAAPWLAAAAILTLLFGAGLLVRERGAGAEARLAALRGELTESRQRADALDTELEETRRRSAALDARLAEARRNGAETASRLRASEDARRKAEAEIADIQAELGDRQLALSGVDATTRALREEVARLENALDVALETATAASTRDEALARVRGELVERERALALVRAPDVGIVDLFPASTESVASASVFWDGALRDCYLHANALTPLEDDRRYALWIEFESGRVAHVSDFTPDDRGEAEFFAALPQGSTGIRHTFVTIEGPGARVEPKGRPVLRELARDDAGERSDPRRRYRERRL